MQFRFFFVAGIMLEDDGRDVDAVVDAVVVDMGGLEKMEKQGVTKGT